MATAALHVDEVGGYAGHARCYSIAPPFEGHAFVTVCVIPGYGKFVRPKAEVFPATDSGACAESTLMSRPGSFVLHDEPDSPERVEGAFSLALLLLGGYLVRPQDA